MATYKDLNSFLKAIEMDLEKAYAEIGSVQYEELANASSSIEMSESWQSRGDRGEPSFEGGEYINTDIEKNGNETIIETRNYAKGELYNRGDYLDEIIQTGEGYQFGNMGARPFIEEAREKANSKIINILDKHLK